MSDHLLRRKPAGGAGGVAVARSVGGTAGAVVMPGGCSAIGGDGKSPDSDSPVRDPARAVQGLRRAIELTRIAAILHHLSPRAGGWPIVRIGLGPNGAGCCSTPTGGKPPGCPGNVGVWRGCWHRTAQEPTAPPVASLLRVRADCPPCPRPVRRCVCGGAVLGSPVASCVII